MRADKIHRAGRRGILSNGKRDRGSLSSFFSFRLVSLVSSFAKEETREMRQRKSAANDSSNNGEDYKTLFKTPSIIYVRKKHSKISLFLKKVFTNRKKHGIILHVCVCSVSGASPALGEVHLPVSVRLQKNNFMR